MSQHWREKLKKNDLSNHSLSSISQTTLNSEPNDDNHAVTKSYVDSSSDSHRNRRDTSTVSNHQANEFHYTKFA